MSQRCGGQGSPWASSGCWRRPAAPTARDAEISARPTAYVGETWPAGRLSECSAAAAAAPGTARGAPPTQIRRHAAVRDVAQTDRAQPPAEGWEGAAREELLVTPLKPTTQHPPPQTTFWNPSVAAEDEPRTPDGAVQHLPAATLHGGGAGRRLQRPEDAGAECDT